MKVKKRCHWLICSETFIWQKLEESSIKGQLIIRPFMSIDMEDKLQKLITKKAMIPKTMIFFEFNNTITVVLLLTKNYVKVGS